VECTINGIGERAGNASLEEIVMAMRVRPDRLAYETAVVSEQLYPSSQMLSEVTGVAVQPNKAIIGRNAFAHEAGIHQDGMLKNPLTYEIMTPQSVGVPDSKLVLGKHSGRHALGLRCEQLGHQFDRHQLDEVYRHFVVLADQIKQVEDHHLVELIATVHKTVADDRTQSEPIPLRILALATTPEKTREHSKRLAPIARPGSAGLETLPMNSIAERHGDGEDYLWGV
jgi:2-isopropylmalate synthase